MSENASEAGTAATQSETVNFFDVKARQTVAMPLASVRKIIYQKSGSGTARYAVRATTDDGRNLTKFVSKATYDALDVPVIE